MTRREIIEKIALEYALTDAYAKRAVTTIFEEIIAGLEQGRRVELRGFGSFNLKHYIARRARNPRSGETVGTPAKSLPAFRAAHRLYQRINQQ